MEMTTTTIDWLAGTRVLLLGHYVPAPMAGYLLHHLGAEVIKVEDGLGDHLRRMGSFGTETAGATSPMFWALNAGFKSLGLQYRNPEGAAILKQLIQQADVVIDGNRAGALERYLGDSLGSIAPHIVYVPITAYGLVGPMRKLAGHDNNILSLAGNLSYTQRDADGKPTVFSSPVADIMAGQMAALGAVAALLGRKGATAANLQTQIIDASMLHAGFFLNFLELSARNDPQYHAPKPAAAWMNGGRPDYRPYRCSDGRFVFFGLIEPWAATRFFNELGREDLAAFLKAPDLLGPGLEALFASQPQAHWVAVGERHDACITPVNDLEDAVQDPQIQALGRMQTVSGPLQTAQEVPSFPLGFGPDSQPITAPGAAPMLGAHNEALLSTLLGFSPAQIVELYDKELLVASPRQAQ
jgi:alpha-methylacyl-CoA racemase